MTILVDTAPIVAAIDRDDPEGGAVRDLLRAAREPVTMSAQITAEIDYLVSQRLGERPRQAFLRDLANGRFDVQCLQPGDYDVVFALEQRYEDLRPGLADLSLIVLADRFDTRRILTFDQRHFRAMKPLQGGSFEILPADLP